MRILIISVAILLMTGCKPQKEAEAPALQKGGSAMNYIDEIAALPKPARDAVFFRAIRDAGLPCQHIIASELLSDTAPPAVTWRAQCENGAYHLIRVQPDGVAAVTSRSTS